MTEALVDDGVVELGEEGVALSVDEMLGNVELTAPELAVEEEAGRDIDV